MLEEGLEISVDFLDDWQLVEMLPLVGLNLFYQSRLILLATVDFLFQCLHVKFVGDLLLDLLDLVYLLVLDPDNLFQLIVLFVQVF